MTIQQLVIGAILVIALVVAIYQFIKTPAAERWSLKSPERKPEVEYAPMYSTRERVAIIVKMGLWLVPLYLVFQFCFLPYLKEYAANANCYHYGPVNGVHIVFFGIFVGLPLLLTTFLVVLEGANFMRAFKAGQFPAPGQKVLRLTPYQYGNAARLQVGLFFIIILFLLGLTIWGGFQAYQLTLEILPCTAEGPE